MNVIVTAIPDVLIIEPKIFGDSRGFFMELYQASRYAGGGISAAFVQDNLSRSSRGVLGGCIYRTQNRRASLLRSSRGAVLDVAVDVRIGSPTFGRHVTVDLNEENRRQFWVPRGFAHGFIVVSETAEIFYKCDDFYSPTDELVGRWDDPTIGIDWGEISPQLSERDRCGRPLVELESQLPKYSIGT